MPSTKASPILPCPSLGQVLVVYAVEHGEITDGSPMNLPEAPKHSEKPQTTQTKRDDAHTDIILDDDREDAVASY